MCVIWTAGLVPMELKFKSHSASSITCCWQPKLGFAIIRMSPKHLNSKLHRLYTIEFYFFSFWLFCWSGSALLLQVNFVKILLSNSTQKFHIRWGIEQFKWYLLSHSAKGWKMVLVRQTNRKFDKNSRTFCWMCKPFN